MQAILKLSRWQEYVPYTLPLTLVGGLMAYRYGDDVQLDWRLITIFFANFMAMAYAFIINDIEDAEDDKHEPTRAARNAIASGDLTIQQGWIIGGGVAIISAALYATGGMNTFITGLVILILSHLYSWKPIRLKALPIVDILSHVLFLSALLMIAPYLIYQDSLRDIWALALSMALFSGYGQFYNQFRDFESDQAAGLKNTASIIGKRGVEITSYLSIVGAVIGLIYTIIDGAFPLWLLPVLIGAVPIGWFFGRGRDMRGDEAVDAVGDVQVQFLIVMNIVLFVWLGSVLLG